MLCKLVSTIVGLFLLFVGLIGATRLPADDDSLARTVYQPTDCPLPCFMGIRPGVTRVDHALDLLRTHDWIDHYSIYAGNLTSFYELHWSGAQPDYIDTDAATQMVHLAPQNSVDALSIPTHVPLGALVLLVGQPALVETLPVGAPETVTLMVYFADQPFFVRATAQCPLNRRHFWHAPTTLHMNQQMRPVSGVWDGRFPRTRC